MVELVVDDVSFRYPGTDDDVLTNLTLSVAADAVCWLRGRNGSGKTTLLEIIAGLRLPDAGTVELDGEPLDRCSVAYVPSEPAVFDELDAREHGSLVTELWGLRGDAASAYARNLHDMLERFDVPVEGRLVSAYSAGMREKLGVSLLLALDTPVVLLDEPFTASDATSLAAGQQMLAERARDRVVVVTSHLPTVTEPLAPTVLDLDLEKSR